MGLDATIRVTIFKHKGKKRVVVENEEIDCYKLKPTQKWLYFGKYQVRIQFSTDDAAGFPEEEDLQVDGDSSDSEASIDEEESIESNEEAAPNEQVKCNEEAAPNEQVKCNEEAAPTNEQVSGIESNEEAAPANEQVKCNEEATTTNEQVLKCGSMNKRKLQDTNQTEEIKKRSKPSE